MANNGQSSSKGKNLTILQLNSRRARRVTPEIREKAVSKQIDILLLQEPYQRNGRIEGFGMGTRIIKDDNSVPWAAIAVINPNVSVLKLTHLCNSHFAIAEIRTANDSIYVASAYFQLSHDIERHLEYLDEVLRKLIGKKILIAIDSNAKSPLWGAKSTDTKGEKLESFIAQWNLSILNDPDGLATVSSEVGEGHPDITIATRSLSKNIDNWIVRDNWTSSDHRVITMKVLQSNNNRDENCTENVTYNRYVTNKADWERFTEVLRNELSDVPDQIETKYGVIQRVKELTKALRKACNTAIPRRKLMVRKVPWWNDDLTKAKQSANKARRKYQKEKDITKKTDLLRVYREQKLVYTKLVTKSRTSGWEEFVTREGKQNPWSAPYKIQINKLKLREVASNVCKDGEYTTDWESTVKATLEKLFPDDSKDFESNAQRSIRAQTRRMPSTRDTEPFTKLELEEALNKMKIGKAPGPDNFDLRIINKAMPIIGDRLLEIYNNCLKFSVFPNEWKVGQVVTIRKGEDKDPTNPASFRPICLLPILGKVLEALILKRLNDAIDSQFCPRQYGFR